MKEEALMITIVDKNILDKLNIEKTNVTSADIKEIGYIKKGDLELLYEQIGKILHKNDANIRINKAL